MSHFVIYYSNIKPVMLLIKMMLAKLQLLPAFDLNQMLNCLHNVHYRDKLNTLLKDSKKHNIIN